MLGLEGAVNVLIELLVAAGSLCGVEIAAACDVAVGRVKVEGARDDIKVAKGEELQERREPRSGASSAFLRVVVHVVVEHGGIVID